jgi:hypothetical protein
MNKLKSLFNNFPVYSSLQFLPKWMKEIAKDQELINNEISKATKVLGKQKVSELIIQFRNKAFAQKGVNSHYIINKLREEISKFETNKNMSNK